MDWFEKLTGFAEHDYKDTRGQLEVIDGKLHSHANGKSYGVGQLELASLKILRERVYAGPGLPGRLKVSIVRGDVRAMHSEPANAGAMFQVASQFNLLEMTSPEVTPEHGVTRYQDDGTQGPACAIAAGAATIYRNYFAKIDGQEGQTRDRQFDGLAGIGVALCSELGLPLEALWTMRNGYAMCTRKGLDTISEYIATLSARQTDVLRAKLCIGVHSSVEVTDPCQHPIQVSHQDMTLLLKAAGDAGANYRYFNHSAGSIPGTVLAVSQSKIGQLTWVAEWHPGQADAPKAEALAKAYKGKTGKDFLSPRIEFTPRLLAAAINKAQSLDPTRIALAMEDLTFDSVVGLVRMRGEDHQLLLPQVVNTIAPVDGKSVKTGWEGTSYGFRTDAVYTGNELAQGTECKMVRPQ